MINEFTYTSSNGTKLRRVFVIKENDQYIGGVDLNLLSPEDAKWIETTYKDFVPTNDFNMTRAGIQRALARGRNASN